MQQQCSDTNLLQCFNQLSETLRQWEQDCPKQVVFFNTFCWYMHVKDCICGEKTVECILKELQYCMPLSLGQESICRFLRQEQELHSFWESSRADFLFLLFRAQKDDMLWTYLFELCETLQTRERERMKSILENSFSNQ